MKAFRFSLEKILEWRKTQLRTAEERLSQLQAQLEALKQQEQAIQAAYHQAHTRLLAAPQVTGLDFQAYSASQARALKEQAILRSEIGRVTSLVDDQRERLVKARRDHKILERLREQRQRQWQYLFDREIENDAAESYLSNWIRAEAERGERS